ncbi:hypothetical protein FYJ24_09495 [Actinomycetaceae bacterium WB03_NA08]|uniref:Uncharacterized protein n=1 Tax=Scrofimicrobium canadense TaxID=2652290 RepID=A0A6N7W928_9ACTO|nr:hypothetical protein [Scrofimicrobium canadense]MSS84993.1 hypothetical protein [Scrofimicrobium canadense]
MRVLTVRQPHAWAIIGIVDLVDVHPSGNFQHPCGCNTKWRLRTGYHLVLANPRALKTPIPYTGALGLRTITDPSVLRELEVIE